MRERRGWIVAAVLLLLGAAAGAGAVREHWLSCRGSMLNGSVLRGYAYGVEFSDACLETMDSGFSLVWPDGQDPWRAESLFGVACALLLALAWAVVVVSHDWSPLTRLLASLPSLGTAAAVVVSVLSGGGDAVDTSFYRLVEGVNVLAVVAFVAIAVRERPRRRTVWPVALALTASTGVGLAAAVLDYVFMVTFSDASWDTPPGTGYPTVVATALMAIAILVIALRPRLRRSSRSEDLVGARA